MKKTVVSKKIFLIPIFIGFIALDQFLKWFFRSFFEGQVILNTGWGLGFLPQNNILSLWLALFILVIFSWFILVKKIKLSWQIYLFYSAVISNIIDRLWLGGITDIVFFDGFLALNLADIIITLLAFIWFFRSVISKSKFSRFGKEIN